MRVATGSTFDGFIREFDGIRIDNFTDTTKEVKLYLLSHSHKDHLRGLEAKTFSRNCKIICSPLTLEFLKNFYKLPKSNFQFFEARQGNSPFELRLDNETVRITLIPSYHSPDSVMFLIESPTKAVLYTGDIRAEHWWVQSLGKNPFLLPYLNHSRILDNIYLDTTFGYRKEPFIEIMSNTAGITFLTDTLKEYPVDDEDVQFFMEDTTTGFEELWVNICAQFNTSLGVDANLKKRVNLMVKAGVPNSCFLQSKLSNLPAKFNVGRMTGDSPDDAPFIVSIKSAINMSLLDVKTAYYPLEMADIDQTTMISLGVTKAGRQIFEYQDRKWLLYGQKLLPQQLRIPFSRHSSYTECVNFVSAFNTGQIYGCVDSRATWEAGFQISRIFGPFCIDQRILFDEERRLQYGQVSVPNEVRTIDKWSESYNLEQLNNLGVEFSFDFKGQHHVSGFAKELTDDDVKYLRQSRRLSNINRMYIGRNISKCNKLINESKFKIKARHANQFSLKQKLKAGHDSIDKYDSVTDSSEEDSAIRARKLCINRNDHRERLIFSDLEDEDSKRQITLSKPQLTIEEGLQIAKDTDTTSYFCPYRPLSSVQDIKNYAEIAATDERGIGWFNIHLVSVRKTL